MDGLHFDTVNKWTILHQKTVCPQCYSRGHSIIACHQMVYHQMGFRKITHSRIRKVLQRQSFKFKQNCNVKSCKVLIRNRHTLSSKNNSNGYTIAMVQMSEQYVCVCACVCVCVCVCMCVYVCVHACVCNLRKLLVCLLCNFCICNNCSLSFKIQSIYCVL